MSSPGWCSWWPTERSWRNTSIPSRPTSAARSACCGVRSALSLARWTAPCEGSIDEQHDADDDRHRRPRLARARRGGSADLQRPGDLRARDGADLRPRVAVPVPRVADPRAGRFLRVRDGPGQRAGVRQKDGSIRAMLNTCAHRGNAVCRADEGNAKGFLCTYHGWSYGIDGRLVGVPGYKNFYDGEVDKNRLGLASVAQLGSYKGFVFATHDPTAPPLEEYLGPTGRLGLDLIAARGDMVVVPGVHKFGIDCNWKIAVDNLFDWYHPQVTHASAFRSRALGPEPRQGGGYERIDMSGVNMDSGAGLDVSVGIFTGSKVGQVVVIGEYGYVVSDPTTSSSKNVEFDSSWRLTEHEKAAMRPVGIEVAGHPSIFPAA